MERLSQPDPEQLMLGGILAMIIDHDLPFDPGYFEDVDTEDIIGEVTGALYEIGEDAEEVMIGYGVQEEQDEV